MSNHYDVIVIGVGGMGSATVYELAKRGRKVLGLERFGIPHEFGSSHGLTRIIRLAYYEDPAYVPLLHRSYELWREIQAEAGKQLLYITGSIDAGTADSEVFTGSKKSCELHGLAHEVLTGRELNARFPGYQFPDETMALFQPEGGFLIPELCIESYAKAAQKLGADIHSHEQVLSWEATDNSVSVTTDKGSYEAEKLIFTAGAWVSKLLPFLKKQAIPERQVLIWLETEHPELFQPERFPVFNVIVEEGRYYGFPLYEHPGFKFGRYHHLDETVDPDTVDRETHPRDEAILRQFAERYFPKAAGKTLMSKVCMFTNSPDEHFILDVHPEQSRVSFAAGFSGHGFKMCSVVGKIMADLAENGQTHHNIEFLQYGRAALR